MSRGDFRRTKYIAKKGKEPTNSIHPQPPLTQPNSENIIPKNSKILQNDLENSQNFSFPSLVSFKGDKSISNFLVRRTLTSNSQSGTFKWKSFRCKTFVPNVNKISRPKRSINISDRFTCISTYVIFSITC